MKNTCASCVGLSVNKVIKTSNEKKPKWLEKFDYVENFIQKNNTKKIKLKKQASSDTVLQLNFGKSKANRFILYWAAQKEKENQILINDARKAYGNFKNHGIAKINKNGDVKLHFNCPQAYSTIEKGKKTRETFYKHVHFCFSNIHCDKWLETVYTKIIVCKYDLQKTIKKHKKEIIRMFEKELNSLRKVHETKNYLTDDVDRMPLSELNLIIQELIAKDIPKEFIKQNVIIQMGFSVESLPDEIRRLLD